MPKQSILQFNNYTVEELFYKDIPVDDSQHEFEISTQFNQKVIELENGHYDVHLSLIISPSEEHPLPFELRVTMVGHFIYNDTENNSTEDVKKTILHKNTVSIMFPFLRTIVASLTSMANIPSLLLPIMDFSDIDIGE